MSKPFVVVVGLVVAASVVGCAGDEEPSAPAPSPSTTSAQTPSEPEPPQTIAAPAPKPEDDPGPAPAGCAAPTKDKNGFFTRTTAESDYVAFVPASYAGAPTRLVVGLHGCGDSAMNFASWGVNPGKTRKTQEHIGISIGGKDGKCWDVANDHAKVRAAIADISACFYVHQQKVVLAGYSSGGMLAYRMGLGDAGRYAGILIENSALGGADPGDAEWKINVAHIAHTSDGSFPIARVKGDWAKLEAAGIPLQKSEVAGSHDGTSDDWSDFLLPRIASWKAPRLD